MHILKFSEFENPSTQILQRLTICYCILTTKRKIICRERIKPNMMTFVKWKEQYKIHNSLDIVSYLEDIIVLCYQIGSTTLCHKRYKKSKMTQSVNL